MLYLIGEGWFVLFRIGVGDRKYGIQDRPTRVNSNSGEVVAVAMVRGRKMVEERRRLSILKKKSTIRKLAVCHSLLLV